MMITTRFRDIPFDEAKTCFGPASREDPEVRQAWETRYRGKTVQIQTPELGGHSSYCPGPYFAAADPYMRIVCPHLVEIGD